MFSFCCPVCGAVLQVNGNSLICDNNHCFDKAKSGYVNLLLSSKMNTKHPGDNKTMVEMRTAFLSKGYYKKLKETISIQIVEIAKAMKLGKGKSFTLLDVGCGEGYYTAAMAESLFNAGLFETPSVAGIDISKEALVTASKRDKRVSFGVASAFGLPVADESMDALTELFAPFNRDEFYRVLKKGGILLLVIPSRYHLYELKQAVYDNPYENEQKPLDIEGFELINKTDIDDTILIDNSEDIKSLFMMTPYAYKTSKEDTARLLSLTTLKTRISFTILRYKKI